MKQPVPNVTNSDVDRVIARDFVPQDRDRLEALLHDQAVTLAPRVVLSVLKLADGELEAVEANLETARRDMRDVIAYAEYPQYMKATAGSEPLSAGRRDEVIRADWAQYQAWLNHEDRH